MPLSRRHLLRNAAVCSSVSMFAPWLPSSAAQMDRQLVPPLPKLPFRLAVINDEISQDFDHACHVVAKDFGLNVIEIRGMWGKNIADLDDAEIAKARSIIARYNLTISDIASPLFKTDLPGAALAPGLKVDEFGARFNFSRQPELLDRCIHLARSFSTPRIRCFDFTRLANPAPARPEIYEQLRKASDKVAKDHLILLLENEHTCNTATGAEAAATLHAVRNTNFMLNWDPGNAAAAGSTPFPNGYNLLPKQRIGHCHCKDVTRGADGKPAWAAVGTGIVDWRGQIRALIQQDFHYTLSLETHWRGAGSAEASTRESFAGLRKVIAQAVA